MFMKRKEALITILYYEDFYRFQMVCNTSLKYLLFENQPYCLDITLMTLLVNCFWRRPYYSVPYMSDLFVQMHKIGANKNVWTIGRLRNSLQTIRSSDHCVQDRRFDDDLNVVNHYFSLFTFLKNLAPL